MARAYMIGVVMLALTEPLDAGNTNKKSVPCYPFAIVPYSDDEVPQKKTGAIALPRSSQEQNNFGLSMSSQEQNNLYGKDTVLDLLKKPLMQAQTSISNKSNQNNLLEKSQSNKQNLPRSPERKKENQILGANNSSKTPPKTPPKTQKARLTKFEDQYICDDNPQTPNNCFQLSAENPQAASSARDRQGIQSCKKNICNIFCNDIVEIPPLLLTEKKNRESESWEDLVSEWSNQMKKMSEQDDENDRGQELLEENRSAENNSEKFIRGTESDVTLIQSPQQIEWLYLSSYLNDITGRSINTEMNSMQQNVKTDRVLNNTNLTLDNSVTHTLIQKQLFDTSEEDKISNQENTTQPLVLHGIVHDEEDDKTQITSFVSPNHDAPNELLSDSTEKVLVSSLLFNKEQDQDEEDNKTQRVVSNTQNIDVLSSHDAPNEQSPNLSDNTHQTILCVNQPDNSKQRQHHASLAGAPRQPTSNDLFEEEKVSFQQLSRKTSSSDTVPKNQRLLQNERSKEHTQSIADIYQHRRQGLKDSNHEKTNPKIRDSVSEKPPLDPSEYGSHQKKVPESQNTGKKVSNSQLSYNCLQGITEDKPISMMSPRAKSRFGSNDLSSIQCVSESDNEGGEGLLIGENHNNTEFNVSQNNIVSLPNFTQPKEPGDVLSESELVNQTMFENALSPQSLTQPEEPIAGNSEEELGLEGLHQMQNMNEPGAENDRGQELLQVLHELQPAVIIEETLRLENNGFPQELDNPDIAHPVLRPNAVFGEEGPTRVANESFVLAHEAMFENIPSGGSCEHNLTFVQPQEAVLESRTMTNTKKEEAEDATAEIPVVKSQQKEMIQSATLSTYARPIRQRPIRQRPIRERGLIISTVYDGIVTLNHTARYVVDDPQKLSLLVPYVVNSVFNRVAETGGSSYHTFGRGFATHKRRPSSSQQTGSETKQTSLVSSFVGLRRVESIKPDNRPEAARGSAIGGGVRMVNTKATKGIQKLHHDTQAPCNKQIRGNRKPWWIAIGLLTCALFLTRRIRNRSSSGSGVQE